jgi:hypothetical protein
MYSIDTINVRYVLERHLKREEALKPGSKPVRTFTSGKGEKAREEVVFNRADVYICRTVENWYALSPLQLIPGIKKARKSRYSVH